MTNTAAKMNGSSFNVNNSSNSHDSYSSPQPSKEYTSEQSEDVEIAPKCQYYYEMGVSKEASEVDLKMAYCKLVL